ncbi:ribosomal protein-like protein S15 [Mollisia scopiformis]|uniref:Ribosomal protein-like protein S15 n=1 Tax=Mollisia scopiformis TaxID=149040 RepID=A0A194X5F1_MOLSC|nr:ribosomal protein-like protein S15 [Mollisia scopiformis]KUJ15304.1 ribosomal protein-like protein S15 [Mollisia scopiformis]
MPPRISVPLRFSVSKLCLRPAPSPSNPQLPIIPVANLVTMAQRRKYKDPYALAQAKQRKDANTSRQAELQKQRKEALGDPVRGITTEFVQSFDNVGGSAVLQEVTSTENPSEGVRITSADDVLLNHFLKPSELEASIRHSQLLTEPVIDKVRDSADPALEAAAKKKHEEGHKNATAALARIVSLANASQKDKTRANIMRCIDIFGRHKTDSTLRPRAPTNPLILGDKPLPEKTPRAGPDTGSSEVQIAILTAKIRVLADQLDTRGGKKDKVNKRNLRIMVHKRQKLLRYLRTKERGGDRWQHVTNTLGLSEGTWKGEISL